MPHIPGLRSPYDKVGGIVYFGRMLDKIRLNAMGSLPADYASFVGEKPGVFDRRCLHFLGVRYDDLVKRTLEGGTDEEILDWVFDHGGQPDDEEIEVWNGFMAKRGWRDESHDRLVFRLNEAGMVIGDGIETMFDFIDADEGRKSGKPK